MAGVLKFNNVEVFGSNGKVTASGMPTGSILQVKTGTMNANFSSTTSGEWLDTGLKVSITPTSSSNKIHVIANAANVANSASGYNVSVAIMRHTGSFSNTDSNRIFTSASSMDFNSQGPAEGSNGSYRAHSWGGLDSPSSTSEQTYVVAIKGEGTGTSRTVYFNHGHSNVALPLFITVMEVVG